jgi:TRAP-type mannitol/chloroaromatic compound transport system permease small subunit
MLIRWYDYVAAVLMADLLMTVAFVVPFIGFVVAYVIYDFGWDSYCNWRLEQEYGK